MISFSSSCCFLPTSIVSFSICRFSYLIFASSSFLYFWRVTWSSSFCFPVIAHCSSSSWFQLSYNLICSTFSLTLKILTWISLSLSSFSEITLLNFLISCSSLPLCLSVTCQRWFSVSVYLFLESMRDFVLSNYWSTFFKCSSKIFLLSKSLENSLLTFLMYLFFWRMSSYSFLFSSLPNYGNWS